MRLRRLYLIRSRTTLFILYALIASIFAPAAVSPPDAALLAAAQNAMPGRITANQLIRTLDAGLWNADRSAMAVSIPLRHPKESLVFIFLKQSDGRYLAADVSGVEAGNFGKFGIFPRTAYERFETTPVEWLHRDDGLFQVKIRTRAWRDGQRYTVFEPLIIRPNGTALYR